MFDDDDDGDDADDDDDGGDDDDDDGDDADDDADADDGDDNDIHLYTAVTPCYCSMFGALGRVESFEACCQCALLSV